MSIASLKDSTCFDNWYDCESRCADMCSDTWNYGYYEYCCYGDLVGITTAVLVISIVIPVIIGIVAMIVGICCCLRVKKQRQQQQQIIVTSIPAGGRPQ